MAKEFYVHIHATDLISGTLTNGTYQINIMDIVPSGKYAIDLKTFHMKNFKFNANTNTGVILISSSTFYQNNTYNTSTGSQSNILAVIGTTANTNYGGAYEAHLNQRVMSNSFYNIVSGINLINTQINIQVTDITGGALSFTGIPAEYEDFNMILTFRRI